MQPLAGVLEREARKVGEDPGRPLALLLVTWSYADHPAAMCVAEPGEDGGADHVQDKLLHRSRLEACRAGDDLCSGLDLDGDVRAVTHRRRTVGCERDGERATLLRFFERADYERRAPTCADADDDVARSEPRRASSLTARFAAILSGVSNGVRLDDLRGDAKGGRALRGVHGGDEPARARAEVVKAAAVANAARDRLDDKRDVRELSADSVDRRLVLGVHQLHELQRAQVVELIGSAVRVFAHGVVIRSAAASAQTRPEPLVAT